MYISQQAYYSDSANYGSYQYTSLFDIVNNFMLMYVGNHELLNNVDRYKVLFHAKQAIKELSIDAFKEVKVLQLNVGDDLRFILPSDFVNWVRISLFKDGVVRPLNENIQINYATQYLQNASGVIQFDGNGNAVIVDPSVIDDDRLNGTLRTMYLNADNPDDPLNNYWGWYIDGYWTFSYGVGAIFGLETSTANFNPTFRIDNKAGVINFSSDMNGQSCILEYISDGQENGDDSLISVNKMFESYIYSEIKYQILRNKVGVQMYVVQEAKKVRRAELLNARIRGINPSQLLMAFRGQDKALK